MAVKYLIALDLAPDTLDGFRAIDACRRLGIEEFTEVKVLDRPAANPCRYCEVDEDFARQWFDSTTASTIGGSQILVSHAHLALADLGPGEAVWFVDSAHGRCLRLAEDLTAQRMRELFLVATRTSRGPTTPADTSTVRTDRLAPPSSE